MRLIDADELLEHVYRDKLDSRELIAEMIKSAPIVNTDRMEDQIKYLRQVNDNLKGQVKALAFAVRCNGVSGNEVRYETD